MTSEHKVHESKVEQNEHGECQGIPSDLKGLIALHPDEVTNGESARQASLDDCRKHKPHWLAAGSTSNRTSPSCTDLYDPLGRCCFCPCLLLPLLDAEGPIDGACAVQKRKPFYLHTASSSTFLPRLSLSSTVKTPDWSLAALQLHSLRMCTPVANLPCLPLSASLCIRDPPMLWLQFSTACTCFGSAGHVFFVLLIQGNQWNSSTTPRSCNQLQPWREISKAHEVELKLILCMAY